MRRVRASVVAFDGDRTLVMLRRKQGREYATLVGGGVEPGESPQQAALRELWEETSLTGTVVRQLPDVVEGEQHAFLVRCSGEPRLGGPEEERSNPWNRYVPTWVELSRLDEIGLRPHGAAAAVRAAKAS